ncbi:hypothetical protein V6N12_052263 [Hibiscus sabdariffa]|uniref:Mitochondrial carrier protein n=1 Tax=Hibiscus sabdariffa TaxID=183260 RepID=A0ABR2GHQ9_9ROSI
MVSSGSTLTTNMAGFVDGSAARSDVSFIDCLPVYVKELIAGGAAGAIAKTTIAPLERIKILLQTRTDGFQSLGVYQSLKKVLKHEGVMGFYKGNGASVIRIIPYAALHFMTYEQYRCWILDNCTFFGSGPLVDLLAGSASGGTAVLCTYPLDLARTKLAYQVVDTRTKLSSGMTSLYPRPAYSGIRDVLTAVYREGGISGLYRGVGPTLAGILPYAGLKFYIYEVIKTRVPEEHQKSIVMNLSCGATAGLLGQTLTYPLDVVRRQMQVGSLQSSSIQGDARYRNTYDGLSTIVRNQGWRQLFAGLSINYIKIVPSVAVGFAMYDMMKQDRNHSSTGSCQAIWPYSGHYLPTEDYFKEFIIFLEEHDVDLANVKSCAVDDVSMHGEIKDPMATPRPTDSKTLSLSCKWTSGVGPCIGCVGAH